MREQWVLYLSFSLYPSRQNESDEAVYFFNPSGSLAGLEVEANKTFFIEETKKSTITFTAAQESVKEFTNFFGRHLQKPHEDFKANEPAYFGAGNFGFCLGAAQIKGGNQQPTFILQS